eukprot:snap_masked-scaffold_15-processed-gene-5.1-mRNA-1 protein AED:0.09 eAED:0.15 QI:0/0/0/1/1/1/6/0/889
MKRMGAVVQKETELTKKPKHSVRSKSVVENVSVHEEGSSIEGIGQKTRKTSGTKQDNRESTEILTEKHFSRSITFDEPHFKGSLRHIKKSRRFSTIDELSGRTGQSFRVIQGELKILPSICENTIKGPISLPGGGVWLSVGSAVMQFGCPPETIKDSMRLGLEVPQFYVAFGEIFSSSLGINIAELEFPTYFNFFIKKRRTIVLTTADIRDRLREVFQETLLGPKPTGFNVADDFEAAAGDEHYPKFWSEGEFLDPARKKLTIDSVLTFRVFERVETKKLHESGRETVAVEWRVNLDDELQVCYCSKQDEFKVRFKVSSGVQEVTVSNSVRSNTKKRTVPVHSGLKRLNHIPVFGVTMLGTSHGFDPNGQTTGFILWANSRGTLVDPPPNASQSMEKLGVSSRLIDSVILTHCHSDHDAGAFRTLLADQRIKIYSTKTILDSFYRKYAAITGRSRFFLRKTFRCEEVQLKPVSKGASMNLHGAQWYFRYSLHTIPCVGFTVCFRGKTLTYSGDTHYSIPLANRMLEKGVIKMGRRNSLANFPWTSDIILHEAGVPPIHTPMKTLIGLPPELKKNLYIVHVAAKEVPSKENGLKGLRTGETVEIDMPPTMTGQGALVLNFFKRIQVFRSCLTDYEMAIKLLSCLGHEKFSAGEFVCRKGDPGGSCYVILQGSAVVEFEADGKLISKCFNAGDYFGESSLVTGEPRNADIKAEDGLEVAVVTKETFDHLFSSAKANLGALADIRNCNSWEAIMLNGVLKNFTTSCKTQLESFLSLKMFTQGELAINFTKAKYVVLIRKGCFELKAGDTTKLVYPGALLGNFNELNKSFLSDTCLISDKTKPSVELSRPKYTEARCESEVGSGLVIHKDDWLKFCEEFPGIMFFLHDSCLVL